MSRVATQRKKDFWESVLVLYESQTVGTYDDIARLLGVGRKRVDWILARARRERRIKASWGRRKIRTVAMARKEA